MNLRRERTHQMGASNLAYHPEPSTPKDKKSSRISFTSLKKGKKATDVIDNKRVSRGLLSPLATTQEMYKSAGKLMHSKTLVGYPRLAQLEEVEKRKMVFTGESFLIYDKVLEKYRDLDIEIDTPVQQSPTKETLAKEKHNIYGTAAQETQLVGYDKHSVDTLKNNVNLEKVREARRVLRRRYASRKNMYSIYNAWDEEHKGVVNIDDVYNMSKKLGLNLNVDEARVLLASANKSGTGVLALDEFLDLIYNKDDVLNVDLDNLATNLGSDYLVKREELEKGDDNLLRKLEEDAKKTREIKHMNQTNLILKNHLHEINMNFLEVDPNHAGYVNYEKFEEVLKRLGISESVVSGNDIKSLFEKHKSDGHTINYKDFIKMLKDFVFHYEDAYKDQKPQIRRAQSINYANEKTDENEFHIVDCRTLPYHSIIDYWTRTKKVNRAIKRFFPNKKDFYAYLGGALHVDKDQVAERYVSGKELKNLVDGLFHNFDDDEVEKRDFEGFLSSCVYNIQGDTNLGEVAKLVYEEEEREFFNKIIFKRKGPGPRKEDAENDINADATIKLNTEEKRTLVELPALSNNTWTKDSGLDKLLQKIDNVFFVGTKKAYEAFKAFDTDKDGYISRKDLAKKLQDMAIMTPEEGQRVLDYVDPENKGYVNFHEFSSKIRPNMVQQDEKGEYTVLPFVTSSKEAMQRAAETIPATTEKVKKMKAAVRPDNIKELGKTRYGANPCWTNTFLNFQASSKSPMFATESERFDRDPQSRVKFQHEAFEKKKQFEDGRLANKQKFSAFFNDRVQQETNALDRLEENRRAKKYMQQVRYEQRAKLFNSYV